MTTHQGASKSCANCGKSEESQSKLKACSACKLVNYCSRDCQSAHRPQHKKACKKRAAELLDEALFRQPPNADDCPICFQMLPNITVGTGRALMTCCGKEICSGCSYHSIIQGNTGCPFCRAAIPSANDYMKGMEKLADANHLTAVYHLGKMYMGSINGDKFLSQEKKDMGKGLKLIHRSAQLGYAPAFDVLANMYFKGDGVKVDQAKAKQYWEAGAIRGCVYSRCHLYLIEDEAGRLDRAIQHRLITASQGDLQAVNDLKYIMIKGFATKDQYAQAIRLYRAYLEEVKSDQRDEAAAHSDNYIYLIEIEDKTSSQESFQEWLDDAMAAKMGICKCCQKTEQYCTLI